MGRRVGSVDWAVQRVMNKKNVGESKAREQARRIVGQIGTQTGGRP